MHVVQEAKGSSRHTSSSEIVSDDGLIVTKSYQ